MENAIDTKIKFKISTKSDGKKCNDFYNRLYQKTRSLNGWHWEFSDGAKAKDKIPYIHIELNEKVVGTQAYIPIQFIDSRGVFDTGKSEETLIDPILRGQGIFPKLYDELFKISYSKNVHGLWGFTPAGKAFRKVGFTTPSTVSQLLRPIKADFISKFERDSSVKNPGLKSLRGKLMSMAAISVALLRMKPKIKNNISLELIETAPEWIDEISQKFIQQWGGVTINRSKNYLDWRFLRNPYSSSKLWAVYKNGQPVGFAATAIDSNIMYLVDLLIAPDCENHQVTKEAGFIIDAVLNGMHIEAKKLNVSGIRAWHGSNHPFSSLVLSRAKKAGWFHYKKGHEIVLWKNDKLNINRLPDNMDEYYITRAFTEGHQG